VVVPFIDSDSHIRSFWFAKVMTDDGTEVSQMELRAAEGGGYRANLRSVWTEPCSAVFHVDAEWNREANTYLLLSSKEEILALIK
jgi:hypothetical protein